MSPEPPEPAAPPDPAQPDPAQPDPTLPPSLSAWAHHPLWASRAWHPGRHPAQHRVMLYGQAVLWVFLSCATAALLWLGALHLPAGIALWIVAALLCVWLYLSGRAWRANRKGTPPLPCSDPEPAQIVSVELDPTTHQGLVRFLPLEPTPSGGWNTPPGCEPYTQDHIPAWALRRYEPGLWVAITHPPNGDPPLLYPPPGGGGTVDILADAFVHLIRSASDNHPHVYWLTPQNPPETPPTPPIDDDSTQA